MSLQFAADNLQALAERWGLVDEHGQDEVQRCMSEAFMPLPELPSDYAAQLVRQWELDDPRDRWRWTGEMQPAPQAEPKQVRAYKPADSTIDAFAYVVRLGDPAYLATWLASHPADAPHLMRLYEAKHALA
ncbi:hypothetical protein JQ572_26130 [Bradyrhizobium japonicum]|nr:hypothetical protein [Bradyrhizobium japonicum]